MEADRTNGADLGAHRHLVVSERLRTRRRELGLTQKEVVARLRRMGVVTTNKALSSLEHGAGLDVAKLPELACALDCTLTYLVGFTDTATQWEPDTGPWARSVRPAHQEPVRRPSPALREVSSGSTVPPILGPVTAG